ncbi:MAG: hypothetical protein H6Q60_359 [Oscillospiraceae bacterium]|nr:hypothetical protein [Oscillospiraceae bacterium]
MKQAKRILSLLLVMAMTASLGITAAMAAPPGDASATTTTATVTNHRQGDWVYSITSDGTNKYATVTYYYGKGDTIIIPSVLGGVSVTHIASLAFSRSSATTVYVPDTVTDVADWAFYDLNECKVFSFANAQVSIDTNAFQSSGAENVYVPAGSSVTQANGSAVKTSDTFVENAIDDITKAWIAGGRYLAVSGYTLTTSDIAAICNISDTAVEPEELSVEIADAFQNIVSESDLVNTFKILNTQEKLTEFQDELKADSSYSAIYAALPYTQVGYYLNGNLVTLADDCVAYDVATGDQIEIQDADSDQYYQYVAYQTNDAGEINALYYTGVGVTYTYDTPTITGTDTNVDGLSGRTVLDPTYLAFASGVVKADGEDVAMDSLKVSDTSATTIVVNGANQAASDLISASANEERSVLWATNDGSITVGTVDVNSTSTADWAKMSYEHGLSSYNVEIAMEWGMNAVFYATNGGTLVVGDADGDRSTITASGDGANGILAGGTGTKTLSADGTTTNSTSNITVYNADFTLTGWNNHVADVVYGGHAELYDITATTGIKGSYAVGQGSSLANDFGNGTIYAKNFSSVVYGNRSAGIYAIGSGVIEADSSSVTSWGDAAVVSASGGTVKLTDSQARGQIVLRSRGGNSGNNAMQMKNTTLTLARDYSAEGSGYVYGDEALAAVNAWMKYVSSDGTLMHYVMSGIGRTIGEAATITDADADVDGLITALNQIDGVSVTADTLIRNSVLDNTYYNYSAGGYKGVNNGTGTDYSEVPFLQAGSSFGGIYSAIMELESAGETMTLDNTTVAYDSSVGADYHYLVANEAGSTGTAINLENSTVEGIIWNEGDVTRMSMGMPSAFSSEMTVNLVNSTWSGVFADGSNGLWNGSVSYANSAGETTTLNGNYYGAAGNYATTLNIDATSTWNVTGDSYIGTLNIADGATVTATAPVTVFYKDGTVPASANNVTFVKLSSFSDMTGYDWANEEISYLVNDGILYGTDETTYTPSSNASLQEFVLMLYRTVNSDTGASDYQTALAWATEYATAAGVDLSGVDTTAAITRETAMTLIAYVLGLSDGTSDDLAAFTDASSVSSAEVAYIGALAKAGVIEGDDAGKLNPSDPLNRAEMAVLLYRALTVSSNT